MSKKNVIKTIISSVIILLPIIFGVIFWDSLPDTITTHFGADGTPDGASSKAFAVFALPLIILALHWICVLTTFLTNRKNGQSDKVYGLLFFIMPMISIFVSALIYATAFNFDLHLGSVLSILSGLMFAVMGNYMPKITRNRTMGIKIKWTLASEANWAATHRVAGRVWFFGGFVVMLGAFLPTNAMMIASLPAILLLVLIPTVYSYVFYKKQLARGEIDETKTLVAKKDKIIGIVCTIVVVILLIGVGILMFTGNVEYSLGDDALTVEATYYESSTVKYADIDSVELCEDLDIGAIQMGFASARLSLGIFKSDDLGTYTLYSYNNADAHVVIKTSKATLVIGLENEDEARLLCKALEQRVGN
jgi:uncharacterized membrane protein